MSAAKRADYGFDAPGAAFGLGVAAVAFLIWTVLSVISGSGYWALFPLVWAVYFGLSTASFVYTTRRGKFQVWRELLAGVGLAGDERVVDLGCGRGAVLLLAARRLPRRRPIGVDLWRTVDQSGNDPARTLANADAEGVDAALLTGDLRALPLRDGTADVVVSSLAIHNIPKAEGRLAAIREAARILRPGGKLVIVDYRHVKAYAEELRRLGLNDVEVQGLGWRFWYGGPWTASSLVTAVR
jgi:arsenite methyltransferase